MTLIERCIVFGGLIGSGLGAWYGHEAGGAFGLVAGVIGGGTLGGVGLTSVLLGIVFVGVVFEQLGERRALGRHFGRYRSHESLEKFERLHDELIPGQRVRGRVVLARQRVIDIGVGFPAYLQTGDGLAELGLNDEIDVRVVKLRDSTRFIVVAREQEHIA